MKKKENIFAMIPARMGSQRLVMKNLALLNEKPLIYYVIQAAKEARVFNRIIINSESRIFEKIARRYGVDFYKRPAKLASSQAKSDSVVYDFIKNNPCSIITWVNPIAPLQTGEEIRKVVDYFIDHRLDSLITVKDEEVHCLYKGRPVNFKMNEIFARTQDLTSVQPFVYSIMMWRAEVFKRTFKRKGYAIFSGKVAFYPVGKLSSVIIKKKEDLMLAGLLLKTLKRNKEYKVRYDKTVEIIKKD
jgi:CMP-N-acetylneuraminic acid synthetase